MEWLLLTFNQYVRVLCRNLYIGSVGPGYVGRIDDVATVATTRVGILDYEYVASIACTVHGLFYHL